MPIGSLTLEILEGKDLPKKDAFGNSDPYVKISVKGTNQIKQTTVKNGVNVRWEEKFELRLHDDNKWLVLEVFDKDFIGEDFMGKAEVELSNFYSGVRDLWVPLYSKGTTAAGHLRITGLFRPDVQQGAAAPANNWQAPASVSSYAPPSWQAGPNQPPAQQHPPPAGPPQQPAYGQAAPYAPQPQQPAYGQQPPFGQPPTYGQPPPAPFGQPGHAPQAPPAAAYGAAPQQPSYGAVPHQPQAPAYGGYSAPAPGASAYPQYGGAPAQAPYAPPSAQAPYPGTHGAPPSAPPGPSTAGLPPGWQEHRDANGRFYYHNVSTNATQWNRPGADTSVPLGWHEHKDPSGRSYYVNASNGQTQWEKPAAAPHPPAAAPSYGTTPSPAAGAPYGAHYGAPPPPAAPPAPAGPPAGPPLPQGWTEHRDPTGRPYYVNTYTNATQWNRP